MNTNNGALFFFFLLPFTTNSQQCRHHVWISHVPGRSLTRRKKLPSFSTTYLPIFITSLNISSFVVWQTLWQHVLLNVGAVTMMTRLILPDMAKRCAHVLLLTRIYNNIHKYINRLLTNEAVLVRGRGAIINMSSSAAIYPLPMMAVYSATKVSYSIN